MKCRKFMSEKRARAFIIKLKDKGIIEIQLWEIMENNRKKTFNVIWEEPAPLKSQTNHL